MVVSRGWIWVTVNAMRTGSSSIVWSIECSDRSMTALTLSTCREGRPQGASGSCASAGCASGGYGARHACDCEIGPVFTFSVGGPSTRSWSLTCRRSSPDQPIESDQASSTTCSSASAEMTSTHLSCRT